FGVDEDARFWYQRVAGRVALPASLAALLALLVIASSAFLRWRAGLPLARWHQGLLRHAEVGITVVLGLGLTGLLAWLAHDTETQSRKEIFERLSDTKIALISSQLYNLEAYKLEGLAGLFVASVFVDRQEFGAYTQPLAKDPLVQAWGWAPLVPEREREDLEVQTRQEGLADFALWEQDEGGQRVPVQGRAVYYPVLYVEPLEGNAPALGYDLGSEPKRRAALEAALQTGLTTASDPLTLVQETETQTGILVFKPVLANNAPSLQTGFVTAALRMESMLRAALATSGIRGLTVFVDMYQLNVEGPPLLLASNAPELIAEQHLQNALQDHPHLDFTFIKPIHAFGKTYAMVAHPGPTFSDLYPLRAGWITWIYGFALTALMALLIGSLSTRRLVVEQEVLERTAELRESERKYRRLAESTRAVLWEFDILQDRWVYVSPQVAALTGWQPEDWSNLQFWVNHLHPEDRQWAAYYCAECTARGEEHDFEYRFLKPDGAFVWIRDVVSVEMQEGKPLMRRGFMVDISERVQRERELEAIVAISRALRFTNSRAEMLPVILDQLAALIQLDGSAIGFHNPKTGETLIELGRGAWSGMTGVRIPAGEGITSQVLATNRPYVNHDIKTDVQMYRVDLHGSLRVAACVPLVIQNQTIGVLWVGRDAPPDEAEHPSGRLNFITEPELNVLQAIAEIAASAIHRTTLHEQTQTQLKHLLSISAIDRAISSSLDIHLTLDIFLKEIRNLLGVDMAAVLLLNPTLRTLDYAAGIGFRSTAIQRDRLRLGEGIAGKAALDRQVRIVVDLAQRMDDFEGKWVITEEAVASYIAAPLISKGQVVGVLEIFQRTPFDPGQDWLELLDMLATQAAIAIDNATLFESLQRANTSLIQAYDATIEGWSRALDLRDEETEGHTERVTELVLRLARRMGIRDQELVHIRRGCLLHDIGKMAIPDSILLKPGPLDDMEWGIMRKHPDYAMQMLSPIAYLRPALNIPYYHHERWDGSGYPGKLKAEAIPLVARIFAVVDVWDALRSNRPYRPALSDAEALAHIRKGAGSHFDPQVVEAFLQEINSGEEMEPPD
ncbi:MAG: CHASE domain-containing protein, partial [Anaerolineaceae bacterium]|nr:CHASE domain-containing protein [Anaerolineaceae bacterium]